MRWVSLFGAAAGIILSSCVTYESWRVTGSAAKDVTRADIASAIAAARANPHREHDGLRDIEVISRDEIFLYWTSKEIDHVQKVGGKWHCMDTAITVG
jgi:hypothetical protein